MFMFYLIMPMMVYSTLYIAGVALPDEGMQERQVNPPPAYVHGHQENPPAYVVNVGEPDNCSTVEHWVQWQCHYMGKHMNPRRGSS